MPEVNVEAIMHEIRAKIKAEELAASMPAFSEIPIGGGQAPGGWEGEDWPEFMDSLSYVNTHYDIPYYWSFGPAGIKTFAKRVVRKLAKCIIPPILENLKAFHVNIVRCLNNIRYFMEGQRRLNEAFRQENMQLRELLSAQAEEIRRIKNDAGQEYLQLRELLSAQAGEMRQTKSDIEHRVEEQLGQTKIDLEALERQSDMFSASVAKAILKREQRYKAEAVNCNLEETASVEEAESGDRYQAIDYFAFQNRFRGTRAQIMQRQSIYLDYFEKQEGPILDVGCGRGEFLRLMKDNGIEAFGVDLYPEYVVEGELSGLDIRQGDGIKFMKETSLTFGGIFASQVIEHISFEALQQLCISAYQKLNKGAYLVLETPNPTSLSIFTTAFYVDPTHNKPVHPLTLEYLLREIGFSEVNVIYTEESRPQALPPIEGEGIRNLDEVNQAIARVSDMLYGSLDYAVIAKK